MFNKIKRTAKQSYYANLLAEYKHDIKQTWKVMKSILNKVNDKNTICQEFKLNDETKANNPKDIANGFCDFFTNVGPKFANAIPKSKINYHCHMKNRSINSIYFSPTDSNEVKKIITSLKTKHSSGPDNISSYFLKSITHEVAHPIAIIINKSMESGEVPREMKTAKVIPIYKSKDKEIFSNYRPISLLPTVSKVLEKTIHKRLYHYFDINHLFYDSQYGFRKQHSTIHAVTEFMHHCTEALDTKKLTISVFLDLSKAFDTIDHNILLSKLEHYGIRGTPLAWFADYLMDRKQFVEFNNEKSDLQDIICGVPQGSVLGPLLFIIYTNDIPNCIKNSRAILFADDTTIYTSGNNIKELYNTMNTELELLTDWFYANKLSLNISKTNYMIIGNYNKTNSITNNLTISNTQISQQPVVKFLGLFIDESLTWFNHIQHIKAKIASSQYLINSIKHIVTTNELRMLYFTLIYPYLYYGIVLWGTAARSNINKLVTQQKKAVRIIAGANYNAHTQPLFQNLQLLGIDDIYKLQLGKFMYQITKESVPAPLCSMFVLNTSIHDHNTRQRNNPHIKSRASAFANKSITHAGSKLWNEIPTEISHKPSVASFSNAYKRHLLSQET